MVKIKQVTLVLLFLMTVFGCTATPTPSPTPTPTLTSTPAPIPIPTRTLTPPPTLTPVAPIPDNVGYVPLPTMEPPAEPYLIEAGEYFVRNQVIVTGLKSDIDTAIETLNKKWSLESDPITVTLAGSIDLGYLDERGQGGKFQALFGNSPSDWTIRLYTLSRPVVTEVVAEAYEMLQESRYRFFVEPNYLIGRSPVITATLGANNPWSVGGDPGMGQGGSAAKAWFEQQWALGSSQTGGIELFSVGTVAASRVVTYTGSGIQVGVFDTSPFDGPGGWKIPWCVSDVSEMKLFVHHPISCDSLTSTVVISDVRDHGLFVASLVHVVAPQSEIHLIRALNDQGQGQLFWLIYALNGFIQQRLDNNGSLTNTVINLSLGVHGSDKLDLSVEDVPNWIKRIKSMPLSKNGLPVLSLEVMIRIAHDLGAVVVAASGNDSCCQSTKEAQIPASYSIVIGVAASDGRGKLSCFSNRGDVAAPGGQGIGNCEPSLHQCQGSCPYGLIGLVLKDTSPTGYAYWAGTSFSTPLVSGLAALLLEKRVPPDSVAVEIKEGAVRSVPIPLVPGAPQPIEIPIANLSHSLK